MVQGTASHVGKSLLTAALCRILRERGLSVAPFKAQNMALNSFVTADGGEIGRAQAFQAEAAGIAPTVDMNPVLLKPSGESRSQVIIHGRVHSVMSARDYQGFRREAARYVLESYERLAGRYDAVVIEGAGSPAEINLRDGDIANMGMAAMADSPVVLVGDIDRGGVFAAFVGTLELLEPAERRRVKGLVINKFRGDASLLEGAVGFVEERTGVPVLGVVPWFDRRGLPDEDGVAVEGPFAQGRGATAGAAGGTVVVAVVRLPRISNFTDFDPFTVEDDVELRYVDDAAALAGADLVVLPGSKNTIEDLVWLRGRGLCGAIREHARRGGMVAGVCGGLQMLGRSVEDPSGVESGGRCEGLGLVEGRTRMLEVKKTVHASGEVDMSGVWPGAGRYEVAGYEIHMGETTVMGCRPFAVVGGREEGFVSGDGSVWGTYIHGLFDGDGFRRALVNELRRRKGLAPLRSGGRWGRERAAAVERLSRLVESAIDVDKILEIMGLAADSAPSRPPGHSRAGRGGYGNT